MIRSIRLASFAVLSLFSLPAQAQEEVKGYNPCGSYAYDVAPLFQNQYTPGIPWPALNETLGLKWTDEEIRTAALFPLHKVEQAIKQAAATPSLPPDDIEYELNIYRSERPLSEQSNATPEYEAAATLYRQGEFKEAITAFDTIVKNLQSPDSAAAAYSAARASLNLGNYLDAAARVQKITSDPAFREYAMAAYHLFGTRAYQSGAPEAIAAHFTEIAHALQAPPSLLCHDIVFQQITLTGASNFYWDKVPGWRDDLNWYLESVFPSKHIRNYNATRRRVLDMLAQSDPFFDLVKALAAPIPYGEDSHWIVEPTLIPAWLKTNDRQVAQNETITIAKAITDHARQKWDETQNPLWGYVLAQRTGDVNDLPRLEKMLANLQDPPKTPALLAAREHLRGHVALHMTRLLVTSGQQDKAIAFLRDSALSKFSYNGDRWLREEASSVLNGGIRYYLESFDLDGARHWASEVAPLVVDSHIAPELRPLLAQSYEELLSGKVPGDRIKSYGTENYTERFPYVATDFLPTAKLRSLSENKDASLVIRRKLLSTAWLRATLLQGEDASLTFIPAIRAQFPELATDMDFIRDAGTSSQKNNGLTRVFLRSPGITLRPSWSRAAWAAGGRYSHLLTNSFSNEDNLFAIDSDNPNDSNWWCPVNIDQMKVDMVLSFFIQPVGNAQNRFKMDSAYASPLLPPEFLAWGNSFDKKTRERLVALADKVIAWHPLFKDMKPDELTALSKVQNGPAYLSQQALNWAADSNLFSRALGRDKYLPETLHLAVRSTRYGCRRNGSNAAYSLAAFTQLHSQYPRSEWAAKTPYWFDISSDDEDGPNRPRPAYHAAPQEEGFYAETKRTLRKIYRQTRAYIKEQLPGK